jgi:3'(2'), 5'-bisphosphate nucleotidase
MLYQDILVHFTNLAFAAGNAVMSFYQQPQSRYKDDGSLLTAADLASHQLILEALGRDFKGIPVISEESYAVENRHPENEFILVDPLDGTKEFVSKNGEFTVNIALVANRKPLLGVVMAPATGELWAGICGDGAWKIDRGLGRTPLRVRSVPEEGMTVLGSRSHGNQKDIERLLSAQQNFSFVSLGSSLKFCRIAEGRADLYPRLGPTMEWDTAAGHAVLSAAGGWVTSDDGAPFVYGKAGMKNSHFIAGGDGRANPFQENKHFHFGKV